MFTLHLNPLIQIILMNVKAQTVYQEKTVPLSQPEYEHVEQGQEKGKHHQCHTKEECEDGFHPLTKGKKIWS